MLSGNPNSHCHWGSPTPDLPPLSFSSPLSFVYVILWIYKFTRANLFWTLWHEIPCRKMRLQRSWEMSKCNEMQLELMLLSRPWPSGVFFIVHICNAIRVWRKNTKEGMKFTPYSQGRRIKNFLGKLKASLTLFGTKVGVGVYFFHLSFFDWILSA